MILQNEQSSASRKLSQIWTLIRNFDLKIRNISLSKQIPHQSQRFSEFHSSRSDFSNRPSRSKNCAAFSQNNSVPFLYSSTNQSFSMALAPSEITRLQQQIRQNTGELNDFVKDIHEWQDKCQKLPSASKFSYRMRHLWLMVLSIEPSRPKTYSESNLKVCHILSFARYSDWK